MTCWKKILKKSLRTQKQLEDFFQCTFPSTPYDLFIPLRTALKIKKQGIKGPLGMQFLPREEENENIGLNDPTGDHLRREKGGIIHRYSNRILFSPTPFCPVQCRYCFRKNNLQSHPEYYRNSISTLKQYLEGHSQVNEVIFTGGDPLMVTEDILQKYLSVLSTMPQIKFIRFHSRTPIMIPERITPGLIDLLQKFHQIYAPIHLVIHINHWSEMDKDILSCLRKLQSANLSIMAQSVLLRGVNDTISELYQLFFNLATHGIRPYYLHHPDLTKGARHFYLPLDKGREIYRPLRDQLPGWALPHYVRERPNGEGKVLALE